MWQWFFTCSGMQTEWAHSVLRAHIWLDHHELHYLMSPCQCSHTSLTVLASNNHVSLSAASCHTQEKARGNICPEGDKCPAEKSGQTDWTLCHNTRCKNFFPQKIIKTIHQNYLSLQCTVAKFCLTILTFFLQFWLSLYFILLTFFLRYKLWEKQ